MAVTNRPVYPLNTMQRKDRQAYTASLHDPRQWPSLGKVDSLNDPVLPVSAIAPLDVSTASSPGPSDASVSLPATRPASQMNTAAGNTGRAPLWTVKAAEYHHNAGCRNQRGDAPAQQDYYCPRQSTPQFSKDSYYDGPSMALPNWQRKKQKFNWRRGPMEYPPSSRSNYPYCPDDSSYYDDYEEDNYYDNGYNNWDNGRVHQWYPQENGMEGYSQDYFQLTNEFATQNEFGYYNEVPAGTVLDGDYNYDAQSTTSKAPAPVDALELRRTIRHQIEYYFSPDNLEKDFFLRRMMAADGSVMLSLVASFQRVAALTDNYQIILEAVVNSTVVEVLNNAEGHMIRPKENGSSWPLEDDSASESVSYYIGSLWGFTPEDFARMYEQTDSSQFDDEGESGTGEDALGEEEEDEEEVSIDGSEVSSELSEDLMKMMKIKEATLNAGLLQQVA
ncbi:hypothetical protein RvY_11521 [Ramazzottius varieornatus]|uniref:HTH La-type RNA-binding domain-containing protein n=1 Tax=Ramazzottius varieornatus TaxID=947166 RepID=A0A1D1VGG2_RAMVA|nr:hypothetical protein RvY_11521 [Ramazzottius varieornatus]